MSGGADEVKSDDQEFVDQDRRDGRPGRDVCTDRGNPRPTLGPRTSAADARPVERGSPCRIISCVNQHANIRLINRRNVASRSGPPPLPGEEEPGERRALREKTEPAGSLLVRADVASARTGSRKNPEKHGLDGSNHIRVPIPMGMTVRFGEIAEFEGASWSAGDHNRLTRMIRLDEGRQLRMMGLRLCRVTENSRFWQ